MKIRAEVKFKEPSEAPRNAECLLNAFFKEFNPQNSITVDESGATLEVNFEKEPPAAIIKAISFCEVKRFAYIKTKDVEAKSTAETKSKKMECMPEIPEFEEKLQDIDKVETLEEKVKIVLAALGWQEEDDDIFKIATSAVKVKVVNYDNIFKEANISMDKSTEIRVKFARLINDYIGKYSQKKVTLLNFLKSLKKVCKAK